MREYLSESNLRRALLLGVFMTVLSVPRIIQGGLAPAFFTGAAFLAMTLISGAATAWEKRAGMAGLFPERHRMLAGLAAALLVALVAIPTYHFWLDPLFKGALEKTGSSDALALRYPESVSGCLALVLWSASFEMMFFVVGAMSLFARLLNRQWAAVLLATTLRVCVTIAQVQHSGVTEGVPELLVSSAIGTAVACMLFARTGLPGPMLLGLVDLRHLL